MADRGGRHYPTVESPDAAFNRACAWAIGRAGGHLRVDPAVVPVPDEGVPELLDDARLWDRIRSNEVIDAGEFLGRVVGLLIGASIDGDGDRLELAPDLPVAWKTIRARRLRAHRTLVDLEVRRWAEWTTVRLAVMFGPPVAVLVRLPPPAVVARVVVDDIPLSGTQAIFVAAGEHEVTLYLGVDD